MKNPFTRKVARNQLETIIKFCEQNHGAVAEIRREYERQTGTSVGREALQKWLASDPAKWAEPLFGSGIMVVKVGNEVMRRWKTLKKSEKSEK